MSAKNGTRQSQRQRQGEQPSESGSPGGDGDGDGDGGTTELSALACNPCRKRKLRCSRELPACQHCRKTVTECEYETKRNKPGLKYGAVENVHRRLDALERRVQRLDDGDPAQRSGREASGRDENCTAAASQEKGAYDILALLARELPKCFNKDSSLNHTASTASRASAADTATSRKRRRIAEESDESTRGPGAGYDEEDGTNSPTLPAPRALAAILDAYFACIHPWIPMLHQSRLRRRLADPQERPKLEIVLHAMTLVASRFVADEHVNVPSPARLRAWVVSTAMDYMSVESLQAMIMLAFSDIGSGQASKAWSLVGSMTRTVEYLQLSVEREATKRQPLSQPFVSVAPTDDWTESEERRRVFWNVFALDRFCSVAMGWNTSLTSDDVHRRLPCDGMLWRKEDPVATPYFGIWDKAAARIGNPIAFLSAQANTIPTAAADGESGQSQSGNDATVPGIEASAQGAFGSDMTTVGAYAYCIEATESLSRVTSHFLQQRIDWRDARDVGLWLTRFKELDLRLVHWKMLLPHKWKVDSCTRVGGGGGDGPLVMDPNLTLAHVTHNASMILLHQPIAFPPTNWAFRARLPSACSVETCLSAATEIANITTKYLETTDLGLPVAHQYAFCIYVAGRALLVNSRYSYMGAELPGELFWTLVGALDEFSRRWHGGNTRGQPAVAWDLAAKYARKLRELHACCLQNVGFKVNFASFTTEIDHSSAAMGTDYEAASLLSSLSSSHHNTHSQIQATLAQHCAPLVNWDMYDPTSQVSGMLHAERHHGGNASSPSTSTTSGGVLSRAGAERLMTENSLGSISQTLLDQQFGEMDRIISFDDGIMFAATMDYAGESAESWLAADVGMEGNLMSYAGPRMPC